MINSTQETLFRLDNLNKEQQRISYQMSTGKNLQQGSDDSNLYAREIYVDDKIKVYEGLEIQIEKTTVQNNTSDSTLSEIKDLLTYVKSEVIKALNDTTDADSKIAIAVNIAGIKENLYDFSNEQAEGEYLFAGSDTQIQPFSKNDDGSISYNGDGFLRKVAVEDGSYRERGITGFDTFMYTSSSASKNSDLEFDISERIIDEDGYEWKMDIVDSGNFEFSSTDTIYDEDGKSWTLSGTNLEDGLGNTIPVTGTGPYTVDMDASTTTVRSFTTASQLTKYDEDGEATSDTLTISAGSEKAFKITTPDVDGTKFEAKANTFDAIDKIINALKQVDSDGNAVSTDVAKESLREGLGEITSAFDAANVGHATLGGRNRVFEISLDRVSAKLTQFNILSQELGAADLTKVAVESAALELTYTALYSTISKVNELSLVNFIK